jgi:hypothetical protein
MPRWFRHYQWVRLTKHDTTESVREIPVSHGLLIGVRPADLHECYPPLHIPLRKGDKFLCLDCKDEWEWKQA